jgi:flavin prenyltransferase
MTDRMVIGISGASGAIYGVRALQMLRDLGVETHLVISRSGRITLLHETDYTVADVEAMADVVHKPDDIGAAISSWSGPARSAACRKSPTASPPACSPARPTWR